jgi:hypothetical protein
MLRCASVGAGWGWGGWDLVKTTLFILFRFYYYLLSFLFVVIFWGIIALPPLPPLRSACSLSRPAAVSHMRMGVRVNATVCSFVPAVRPPITPHPPTPPLAQVTDNLPLQLEGSAKLHDWTHLRSALAKGGVEDGGSGNKWGYMGGGGGGEGGRTEGM